MDASRKGQSEQLASMIWTVCTPIIFTIGIVGNALTIIVLNRKTIRSSTTVYLTLLAIVDFLFILVGMPRWFLIYNFGYDFRHSSTFVCKVHWFMLYTAGGISTLLLVILTSERILSTSRPYTVRTFCSLKRSVVVATISTVFVCVTNSHILYGFDLREVSLMMKTNQTDDVTSSNTEPEENNQNETVFKVWVCSWTHNEQYRMFYERYFLVWIFVIQYVTPLAFIVAGGIFIVWKLLENNRLRKGMNQNSGSFESRRLKVTNMLLMVNAAFIILETPVQVFMTGRPYWMGAQLTPLQEVVWAIISMMNYFNRAVNFILYFLSGTRFRKSFMEFITCKGSRRPAYIGGIARVALPDESENGEGASVLTSPI